VYKWNIDAVVPNKDGSWGIPVLIRGENGVVVAASCCRKLVQSDSDQADTLALKEGLQFAKDTIFLNLVCLMASIVFP